MIGIELFLLLDDITLFRAPKRELPEITGERIAELRDRVGGVRWQNPKDIVWNETRGGQALYEGQSVMTLSDSSARLVFDARTSGGAEIEIGPSTLLQLQAKRPGDERPLLLSLARGTLRANTARALDLAAGEFTIRVNAGSRFEAENVAATASRSGRPSIRLKVLEGGANAGDTAITRDQTLEVPILTADESSRSPSIAPVVIEAEVAATPEPSPTPSVTPSATPPAGVRKLPPPKIQDPILRRRRPTPAPREKTGASLFDLLVPSASAADEAPVESAEEWEIELRWEPVAEARRYRVEISRTKNFAKKIAAEETTEARWTWPYRRGMENSKGRVYYRVASVNERGKIGAFSEPIPFQIPAEIYRPVAKKAPKPTPVPVPTSVAAVAPPAPPGAAWSFRPAAEITSLTETSDYSQLKRVDTGGAYLHESLAFARTAPRSVITGNLRTNHFKSESGTLPKTRSYRATLTAERRSKRLGGKLHFGIVGHFSDHFEKADANSLRLKRGLSFGPTASLVAPLWSLVLRLPVTGAIGSGAFAGAYGPTIRFERDWKIAGFYASLSAEGSYHFWDSESTATVAEWSIGFGPKFRLE